MNGIQQRLQPWVKGCLTLALLIGLGAMQARAATYYVATNGNDNNPGTQASPWRHIAYAVSKVVAGDTVMIKGGNYGNEYITMSNKSGTASNRITFEGYDGWPVLGTLPSPRTAPPSDVAYWGFRLYQSDYVTLRNIKFTYYYNCLYVELSDHVTADNIYVDKCGSTGASGTGIFWKYSDYGTITDCTVVDAGGNNMMLAEANYCLVDNFTSRGTLDDENSFCTDYYCVMRCCHDTTIQNSYAEDEMKCDKGNHGFIIKDMDCTAKSYNNLIQDCTAIGVGECFVAAHGAYNNTFLRCYGNTEGKDNGISYIINCRNGAHGNTWKEITGVSKHILIGLSEEAEGAYDVKYDNKFINCVLKGTPGDVRSIGVLFRRTNNNTIENCVLDNVDHLGRYIKTSGTDDNISNKFKNCIIAGMAATYDPAVDITQFYPMGGSLTPYNGTGDLTVTYTDFWDNDFSALSGTGNISSDPKFADRTNDDYHLKSTGGRWTGSAWVLDTEDSPCIDAGDPASSYANEPEDNGDRINIGGYGNTAEASKSAVGEVVTYMDNRLAERSPTTVYGSNSFLDVGHNTSNGYKYRDLVYFDLAPYYDDAASSITNATLSMYWYYPSSTRTSDTVVDVMKPESGWDHGYVCWNNKSNGVAWTYAGGDWTDYNGTSQGSTPFASVTFAGSQVATYQYYDWNVTQLVRDIVTAGSNPGMLLKAHTESNNYIAFYGGAAAGNLPKLSVTRRASQSEPLAYDNRLKQSDPNTVLGTSTFNDVGMLSGNSYRDLIWFDLTPYEDVETVAKATLYLYWYYPTASTRTNDTIVDIYRPATGWTRTGACWNNKASGVAWTNAGGDWYDANGTAQGSTPFATVTFDNAQVATNQYYQFDVTDLVNYYKSTGTNAGFFIKARTESNNYIAFYSLNYGTVGMRPKLEITTTIQQ